MTDSSPPPGGAIALESTTDADLWRIALTQDPEAFGIIFDRHLRAIHRFCTRRTGSADVADDLVSIVFLEAWRCRHRVRLEQESALPWLYAVARHTLSHRARSQFRHRKALARIPIDIVDDPADDIAKRVDDQRTLDAVDTAFAQLKADDQDVIALCVWQGLEYAEAAVALEIPLGTVRSRLSRARARLAAGRPHLEGRIMKNPDTGPTTRPPNRAAAARARAALMAQVRDTPLDADFAAVDAATISRSGVEGAPRELKKRYIALGTGLVAAAAGAAIIFGGTVPFGDDLGLTPAAPDTSAEVIAAKCLDSAKRPWSDEGNDGQFPLAIDAHNEAVEAGPFEVVTTHVEEDYQVAFVSNGSLSLTCFGDNGAIRTAFDDLDPALEAPTGLSSVFSEGTVEGSGVRIITTGRVSADIQAVTVEAADGQSRQAHLGGGYFSAELSSQSPETELSYVLARSDGSTETISGSDLDIDRRSITEIQSIFPGNCVQQALDTSGYGLSEKDEAALLVSLLEDPPAVVSDHVSSAYQFVVVRNETAETVCVGDNSTRMDVSQTLNVSSGPEHMDRISLGSLTQSGEIVEVGRASANVSAIVIKASDGHTTPAMVADGYYSAVLDDGSDSATLTYEVTFQDGSTETITDP